MIKGVGLSNKKTKRNIDQNGGKNEKEKFTFDKNYRLTEYVLKL